jgi:4-amino-4-deoxy-L-arabinose transferase-like glycosyltransferase
MPLVSAPRRLDRVLLGAAVAASLTVLTLFALRAGALIAYPWDWSPDEGLSLDWGRRAALDPASLYQRSFVPYPAVYGPVLPALLAPLAAFGTAMLPAARVLALGWTGLSAFAVYLLCRRVAGWAAGLSAAALSLAALDVSFWSMLVRADGPMLALWLLAAVALLPARLERGGDRLGWTRIAAGSALLLAAVLTKPTALLLGAPLVLGWLLVDTLTALRLGLALSILGSCALALLEWATGGAFLWLQGVWSLHGAQPGLRDAILRHSLDRMWPYAAFAVLALGLAMREGRRWREALADASVLLTVGAAAVFPVLSKYGASWNYTVPFVPALTVIAARWLAPRARPGQARALRAVLCPALAAALAVTLVATRAFPLPTEVDQRTATAFYAFVGEHTRRAGGPILAIRPEMAYVIVGQPVEMEGSGFATLARRHAPGTELVLQRLQRGVYTLLVQLHDLPEEGGFAQAARREYVHAGGCNLSFYFGTAAVHLFTRRDLPFHLTPPPGTRCGGPSPRAGAP